MTSTSQKTALVTGGGTGIGRGVVELLVERGYRVVAVGRRKEPLSALAKTHGESKVAAFAADVTRAGDAKRAIDFTVEKFGSLDTLVCNAGRFVKKPLSETSDEEILQTLDVNVRGPLSFCREALPHLQKSRGAVVLVSSAAGLYARAQLAAYGAAKAALHHATKILAVELGPVGIRVNAVAPGLTKSEMTEEIFADSARLESFIAATALRRFGEPSDIAKVVAFLASDEAAWVTGQVIAASGGLLL